MHKRKHIFDNYTHTTSNDLKGTLIYTICSTFTKDAHHTKGLRPKSLGKRWPRIMKSEHRQVQQAQITSQFSPMLNKSAWKSELKNLKDARTKECESTRNQDVHRGWGLGVSPFGFPALFFIFVFDFCPASIVQISGPPWENKNQKSRPIPSFFWHCASNLYGSRKSDCWCWKERKKENL